ncbi:MAG: rhodanese-like domain-containing protein [Chthoniobacter sp.]|nr:rhodanese-like domain-containing protein [Chthoniobacter sp.]
MKIILASIVFASAITHAADPIPNRLIDYAQFQKIAREVAPVRETRRLTAEQFAALAAEPGTVVLDARSADKFQLRHIRGAVSLPFTDFTAEALAQVIPKKDTRVLIYCNNNFLGDQRAFASKMAPASLNISTYIALATYGYTNIYELGPLLNVANPTLQFDGTATERVSDEGVHSTPQQPLR